MSTYRFISAERASFPVSLLCVVLEVSKSGFYAWTTRAPSDRTLSDAWLSGRIEEIHGGARGVYGARRIHAELRHAHGVRIGRKRIERLMREGGLSGLVKRKRGKTTIRVPGVRVADDLVDRRFFREGPNRLWVADITYLPTWEGWLYLAAVQDAFSRRIVGWAMAEHMRSELVVEALEMAVARRRLHLRALLGGAGVLRVRARRLLAPDRRLAARSAHASRPRRRRASDGARHPRAGRARRARPPLRSRQPAWVQPVLATVCWLKGLYGMVNHSLGAWAAARDSGSGGAAVVAEARPEGGPERR